MTKPDEELPQEEQTPGDDQLDWNIARDGRMKDYATDDDAVETVPWEG